MPVSSMLSVCSACLINVAFECKDRPVKLSSILQIFCSMLLFWCLYLISCYQHYCYYYFNYQTCSVTLPFKCFMYNIPSFLHINTCCSRWGRLDYFNLAKEVCCSHLDLIERALVIHLLLHEREWLTYHSLNSWGCYFIVESILRASRWMFILLNYVSMLFDSCDYKAHFGV